MTTWYSEYHKIIDYYGVDMPTYLIKAEPDGDLFIEWSTVVDNAVSYGTREDYLSLGFDPERIDRAEQFGTSALWPQDAEPRKRFLGWDAESVLVHNDGPEPFLIRREDVGAYVRDEDVERFNTDV